VCLRACGVCIHICVCVCDDVYSNVKWNLQAVRLALVREFLSSLQLNAQVLCQSTHCVKAHTVTKHTLCQSTHYVKAHTVSKHTLCQITHCVKAHTVSKGSK